jgi:arylsulfatase/uncharacterized sulfatase
MLFQNARLARLLSDLRKRPGAALASSLALALALGAPAPGLTKTAPNAPNIVLVVIDDGGYTDLGAYGSEIATPNIDALAARGARFSNFHASPMCAPSRAMLLTGVDSHTAGIANLPESTPDEHRDVAAYRGRLAKNVTTVSTLLQNAGYHTWMAGKWHLGHGPDDLPNARGFDRSFALDATGGDNYQKRPYLPLYKTADWFEDGKPADLPKDFYSSKFLVDRLIRNIETAPKDGKPFFAYLPFLAIHIPTQAPQAYVDKYRNAYAHGWDVQRQRRYDGAVRTGLIAPGTPMGPAPSNVKAWNKLSPKEQQAAARHMAVNAGMLEAMDAHFGRLVAHLKQTGQYDNTLFVILSDNGPEAADPAAQPLFRLWLNAVGYSSALDRLGSRGAFSAIGPGWASAAAAPGALFKFYASEGGMRVPLIISGPGVQPATARAFSFITDVTPTLLDYAGVAPAPAPAAPIVGRTLRPLLSGAATTVYDPATPVSMEAAGDIAVFKGDLKLTRNAGTLGSPDWRLYDIIRDPGETRDLSAAMPEQFAAMKADYEAYAARVGVAEVPKDYAPDKQVAKASGPGLIKALALPAGLGLAAVAGVVTLAVVLAQARRRRLGRAPIRVGQGVVRGLVGFAGVLSLLIASRFWLAPAELASTMGLTAEGPVGLGTIRADMAAFFGAAAILSLTAAVRNEARWLTPVLLLLALALAGRVFNLVSTGGGAALIPPMVIEAVLIAIMGLGRRVLGRAPGA